MIKFSEVKLFSKIASKANDAKDVNAVRFIGVDSEDFYKAITNNTYSNRFRYTPVDMMTTREKNIHSDDVQASIKSFKKMFGSYLRSMDLYALVSPSSKGYKFDIFRDVREIGPMGQNEPFKGIDGMVAVSKHIDSVCVGPHPKQCTGKTFTQRLFEHFN